jgi:DNA-binding transcriptional regulator YiaG
VARKDAAHSPARSLRRKLQISPAEFATRYHIALATLLSWEDDPSTLDTAHLALPVVIDADPNGVAATLAATRLAAAE